MSSLPSTWMDALIGSVCVDTEQVTPEGETEFTYVDIGSIDRFKKKVTSPQRLLGKDAPSRARKLIRAGDTIVSTTRPNLNAVALVDQSLDGQIASTGFEVLRAPGLDPRWLGYLVRTGAFVDAMTSLVQGALYPAVRGKDVRSFVAPIAPSNEQKRIADKLDTVLARIDALDTGLAQVGPTLKRFRQSVLSAATSGRLTEDWRVAQAAHLANAKSELDEVLQGQFGRLKVRGEAARVSQGELYELPDSWAWALNHQLAEDDSNAICAGPFGTIFKAKDFREEGVPIIFLRHIGEGHYLTHKPGFMATEVWREHHQPYSVFGGELLVTKLGDPPGTACIYPEGVGTAMVTPDVMKMSVNPRAAQPLYLMHFFNSPNSKRIVEALCFGVTRLRIDLSMFKTFPIPLPPRKEQVEIVRRVETLFAFADRLETRLLAAQSTIQRLTPALLAKAFSGELVPQDPNDESASELLRRLQLNASSASTKRGRKSAT